MGWDIKYGRDMGYGIRIVCDYKVLDQWIGYVLPCGPRRWTIVHGRRTFRSRAFVYIRRRSETNQTISSEIESVRRKEIQSDIETSFFGLRYALLPFSRTHLLLTSSVERRERHTTSPSPVLSRRQIDIHFACNPNAIINQESKYSVDEHHKSHRLPLYRSSIGLGVNLLNSDTLRPYTWHNEQANTKHGSQLSLNTRTSIRIGNVDTIRRDVMADAMRCEVMMRGDCNTMGQSVSLLLAGELCWKG
ncbi:hypothetical protein BU24DRAFT_287237 [Aaosphaeria arxii CBS 175.79]|uniref:Uncharacterized protein n=1 Tax=Aaosphaeria arxii CBS 175.79 TaxID=1450172 RepID=A0A6A5XFH1_9PLEO|nr:uncharacterized protein BU24DRAFT_287237 [Aaosphaeria arxii CBS 175.79]KAF2011693.1 hypothetical protein BU24DRAFT_287237 [Aaosphaeria arxii CBS 175.79]